MAVNVSEQQTHPLYTRIDVVGGALMSALAVLIWYGSVRLPIGELRYFGSGFLPRVCAGALLVGGVALLIRGLRQTDAEAERLVLASRGPLLVGLGIVLFALTIRGYEIGPLTVPQLGLLVAGPLAIIVSGLASTEARLRELVALAFGLSGLGALVFVELLGVRLPMLPLAIERALPGSWGVDWPSRIAGFAFVVCGCLMALKLRSKLAAGGAGETSR